MPSHTCFECGKICAYPIKDKVLVNVGQDNKFKLMIYKRKNVFFCSESCRNIYIERVKEEINTQIENYTTPDLLREEYNRGYEDGSSESYKSRKSEVEESYMKGINDGIKMSKICFRCQKRTIESVHHIIPKGFGGENNIENLITLCNECHDIVEEETYNLLSAGKTYSTSDLLTFIKGGFPSNIM